MTCEKCWSEAFTQSRALGGTQAERYREQLDLHPEHFQDEQLPIDCSGCGYQIGSFACKIRHLQINTGAAKAAGDA